MNALTLAARSATRLHSPTLTLTRPRPLSPAAGKPVLEHVLEPLGCTWRVSGVWYPIGSKESFEEANLIFARSGSR